MSKRVALIGNMNNNLFAIARHLRDRGYDAHLFYRVGMDHFQPKADTYSLDYDAYCHEVSWLDKGFHNVNEAEVQNDLRGFDFYIGQGDEAAVAVSCGFDLDVYYTYGSDVSKYSYLPQEYGYADKLLSLVRRYQKNKVSYSQMKKGTMAKYQRKAITDAKYVLAEYTNREFISRLEELQYKGKFEKIPMPFIYPKDYEGIIDGSIPDVHWKSYIQAMRKEYEFIILYHGRQEWKTFYNEFNGKNTHHLLIGFANYVKQHPDKKICLALLEYGNDVKYSKELIEELGIKDKVKWFPKMYRKDLMFLINNADVCCGEFRYSYLTFGTVVEAMLLEKPVIHYREDSLYTDVYPELYPMLHAKEPEEIETAIEFAVNNPEKLNTMGKECRKWITEHFIEKPTDFLQNLIEQK